MTDATIKIIEVTLKSDASVSPVQRNKILKLARNDSALAPDDTPRRIEPRIYSRGEAAQLLGGKTTRFVDLLCRRGLLKKFTPPGNRRAIGITGESLTSFISGT
jgi:hypothetical protein